MGRKVIVELKIMSLALFFSGCNHYKSIHFADAKIRKIFDSTPAHQKKFPTAQNCHLPTTLSPYNIRAANMARNSYLRRGCAATLSCASKR